MRELKYHEQRLLRKVNFYKWRRDKTNRENKFINKYLLQDREDYHKYNKLCGLITKLVSGLRKLDKEDLFRIRMTDLIIDKLYRMGVIRKKGDLSLIESLPVSSFCRRRLSLILLHQHFANNLQQANQFIIQGQIRIGKEVVTNPSLHITREEEDLIQWADGSSVQRHLANIHNNADDFHLLQA